MASLRAAEYVDKSELGKPLKLFEEDFIPSCKVKEAVMLGMEWTETKADSVEEWVQRLLDTAGAQLAKQEYGLTDQEVLSIAWYTVEIGSIFPEASREENVFFKYNQALRSRKIEDIKVWRDFSWFLVSALRKLPPTECTVYRGVPDRITTLSSNYYRGNQVVWVAFTSTTLERDHTMQSFANYGGSQAGGTFLCIKAIDARDVSKLSLLPNEQECILMPNARFVVEQVMSAEAAASLRNSFGSEVHLPGVDMIVLQQVESDGLHVESSTSFDSLRPRVQAAANGEEGGPLQVDGAEDSDVVMVEHDEVQVEVAGVNAPAEVNGDVNSLAQVNGEGDAEVGAEVNTPADVNTPAQINALAQVKALAEVNNDLNAQVNAPAEVNVEVNDPAQVNSVANDPAQVNAMVNDPAQVKDDLNANVNALAQVKALAEVNNDLNAQVNAPAEVNVEVNDPAQVNAVANDPAQVNAMVNDPAVVNAVVNDPPLVIAEVNGPAQVNVEVNALAEANAMVNDPPQVNAVANDPAQVNAVANDPAQVNAMVNDPAVVNAVVNAPAEVNAEVHAQADVNAEVNSPVEVVVNAPPQAQGGVPARLEPDRQLSVIKEGWLKLRTTYFGLPRWRKRYFVLDNAVLYVGAGPFTVPEEFCDLRECKFRFEKKTCCFDIVSPSRVLRVQAPDGAALQEWKESSKKVAGQPDCPYFCVEQTTRLDLSPKLLLGVMSRGLRLVKLGLYDPGFEEEIACYNFEELYSWDATSPQTFEFRAASERIPFSFKTVHAQEIKSKLEAHFIRWREWRLYQQQQ